MCAGLAFVVLADQWFAAYHLDGPVTASDFQDYCVGLYATVTDQPELFPARRSRLAAVPASWFVGRGVQGALGAGAWVSSWALGAGLFLWARSLSSRTGGALAVLLALSFRAVVLHPRMLTFYPTLDAVFVLSAAAAAAALLRPTTVRVALAGLGVGACLLIDVRGVIWAAPFAVAGGIAAASSPHPVRNLVVLAAPVGLAWGAGGWAYPPHALSLEAQLDPRGLVDRAEGVHLDLTTLEQSSAWLPGHGPPRVLALVRALLDSRHAAASGASEQWAVYELLAGRWLGSAWLGLVALVGSSVKRARPWVQWRAVCAVGLSASPFLLAWVTAPNAVELQLRFVSQFLVLLPVVLGAAMGAWIARAPARVRRGGRPPLRSVLQAASLAFVSLLVFGVVPSALGPAHMTQGPVQHPNIVDMERVDAPDEVARGEPAFQVCRQAYDALGR